MAQSNLVRVAELVCKNCLMNAWYRGQIEAHISNEGHQSITEISTPFYQVFSNIFGHSADHFCDIMGLALGGHINFALTDGMDPKCDE